MYWILYVIILLALFLFAPVEFAFIFMIGGFFVFRSLSRRSKVKAVTSKVAATHTSSSVKSSKWDDDFDDEDDEDRYDETGEFEDDEELRNRDEEREEREERWTYEEDQDDNSSRDDD